jgi:hypothetical protein
MLRCTVAVLSCLGACCAPNHPLVAIRLDEPLVKREIWVGRRGADLVGGGGDVAIAHGGDGDGGPVEGQDVARGYVRLR